MLHELLKHIKCLSKGRDRETSVVERTSSLKRYLVEDTLTKLQSSHPKNIFLFTLLISTHVRTVLTLRDCDLQDNDLTKVFVEIFLEKTTGKAKR